MHLRMPLLDRAFGSGGVQHAGLAICKCPTSAEGRCCCDDYPACVVASKPDRAGTYSSGITMLPGNALYRLGCTVLAPLAAGLWKVSSFMLPSMCTEQGPQVQEGQWSKLMPASWAAHCCTAWYSSCASVTLCCAG